MKIKEIENGILLEDVNDFDATHTLECGQSFRWNKEADGSYTGVAYGKVLNIKSDSTNRTVVMKNTNMEDFNNIWVKYFDLERDYGSIKRELAEDPVLDMAIKHAEGIRILKQEPWELVISYIISANNSIPLISRSINLLSELYGEPIEYNGRTYHAFPTVEELSGCVLEDISRCRAGFRCKYIHQAAGMVHSGVINLDSIAGMDTEAARKELMRIPGVGPKVADCIMLFSMQKFDTYPADVWIKRVTEYFFLEQDVSLKEIQKFAKQKFGNLAGFAQEYLFYYARDLKISPDKKL